MTDEEVLKGNKLIAEFMGIKLPKNTILELKYIPDDHEKEGFNFDECYEYAIRDFDNNPTFNYHEELEDEEDDQLVYHPTVLSFNGRYFIYGKDGYHKSALSSHPEISVDLIKYANANGLKYHSSWDYIMPVVEKIESLGYHVTIKTNMVSISRDNKGDENSYLVKAVFGDESKLQKLYKCIISAIRYTKLYDKNK